MIRDPRGHGGGRGGGGTQTCMRGTKIIHRTKQIHPVLHSPRAACQCPAATCQRRQVRTKGGGEPLDGGGVDHPITVRATPERLDPCGCPINDAPLDVDHAPLLIPLDDVSEAEVAPRTQPRSEERSSTDRIAQGFTARPHLGAQAIGTAQERARQCTAPHPPNQATHQRPIAVRAHLACEPQAAADPHRQRHPDAASLLLDADRVGLSLAQVVWRLDQLLLHRLALDSSARQPTRHCPLVIAKRHDDRWQWTPVGPQGPYQADRLRRGPQAIQCGAFRCAERLVALRAEEALVLTRMDTNVTLAGLASGGALQIGAKCAGGVHVVSSPGVAGEHAKKEYVWTPIFIATAPHHGLVGSYPPTENRS